MNRNARIALPALLVLAVLGWAAYQYFIVADAPEEVSTSAALEQLSNDLGADAAASPAATDADDATSADTAAAETQGAEAAGAQTAGVEPTSDADATIDADAMIDDTSVADATAQASSTGTNLAGEWTVDDDFGEFAFESASGSFAGFRVDKELFVGGVQVAVGRSGDITGTLSIVDGAVAGGTVVVDTTAMRSDIGQRESAITSALRTSEFPTATFVIGESAALDTAALAAGETVAVAIAGQLTIAGATHPVTVNAEATIAQPGLGLVVGTADLTWADFGIETPSSTAGSVADQGTLEFQLIVRSSTS